MISSTRERRRGVIVWAVIASLIVHVAIATLLFDALAKLRLTTSGESMRRPETITITVQQQVVAEAKPVPKHRTPPQPQTTLPPVPPAAPRHELARESPHAPPQPPERHHAVAETPLERDQKVFANEVASLNQQNDPHAIATIDPASAGVSTKSYRFDTSRGNSGDEHGNGVITPTQSWKDRGEDCYYARYEYTYPTGATEEGNIAWPVCYDPGSDPFHEPPHPMPFPLPVPGYTLPPGTDLPPLEKQVYDEWASGH